MKSYLLIALALALLSTNALAQTTCPGSSYLGWGQGFGAYPSPAHTDLSVTFPDGAGIALCSGPFEIDADANAPTCNPTSWNGRVSERYGTVTYNDGEVSYSGAAKFSFDMRPAATPYCVENGVPHFWMVARLKIQSCTTTSHTLTNRFIAVSCDGSYCAPVTNVPCDSNYAQENWLNLTVSGF